MAQLKRYLDPLSPHQLKKKESMIKFGPPLLLIPLDLGMNSLDPDQDPQNVRPDLRTQTL